MSIQTRSLAELLSRDALPPNDEARQRLAIRLEAALDAAARAEREACAELAEESGPAGEGIAQAIRARGDEWLCAPRPRATAPGATHRSG